MDRFLRNSLKSKLCRLPANDALIKHGFVIFAKAEIQATQKFTGSPPSRG